MNTEFARQQMVEQQVRAWDVFDDNVLSILSEMPREDYVPAGYEDVAYADAEIPLGFGETMMTPTHEGRLLQALAIGENDSILEIGTGSGYLTACMAILGNTVSSIDIHEELLAAAKTRLDAADLSNVTLQQMDATAELPEGQFDVIAVTGSIETFDTRFVEALAPGGRLFVVVGESPAMEARLLTKVSDSDWQSECLFETDLKPLVNGSLPPQFAF